LRRREAFFGAGGSAAGSFSLGDGGLLGVLGDSRPVFFFWAGPFLTGRFLGVRFFTGRLVATAVVAADGCGAASSGGAVVRSSISRGVITSLIRR
jgi:hypothetical protein